MERFAVLGLVGLALTLCIIAGEIDLSIGSNAALAAVIVVRFTDQLGAPTAALIAIAIAGTIGLIQGYFIAYLRIRAIVLTVGTLDAASRRRPLCRRRKNGDAHRLHGARLHHHQDAGLLLAGEPPGDPDVRPGRPLHELHALWPGNLCDRRRAQRSARIGHQSEATDDDRLHHLRLSAQGSAA